MAANQINPTNPQRHPAEKAQSLVELALALVLVLTILAGVVDLGRVMFEYQAMRDAAQEGAGYGTMYPNACAEIENRVMANLPDASYTVAVTVNGKDCAAAWSIDEPLDAPQNGCAGKELIVAIDHNFAITMPFLSTFTGPELPLHVVIKDRIVRPACD